MPLALLAVALTGCSRRTLEITSEPSGALVWVNDVELGRTPLKASFQHYGEYDVLLRKDGFEPLRTHKTAYTPLHQRPPLDLVTAPLPIENTTSWHFTLEPSKESTLAKEQLESELTARADELRKQVEPPEAASK
jgi:hypothetical protein